MTPTKAQTAQTGNSATALAAAPNVTPRWGKLERLRRRFRRNRSGASAVEFAIVAPIFFLLIFGMIEYGRLVMVQQVLTNATREGARRAILQDATVSSVTTVVRNYLTNSSINGNNPNLTISVTPDPQTAGPSDESITVSVSLPFRDVSWLPSPLFLNATTLNSSSVMRRESFD
jgi:Flp pilus assembly protein TadG